MEFIYDAVAFTAGGMELFVRWRHDDTPTDTPLSSASAPRYESHGHTAMATSVGAPVGSTPITP